MKNKSFDVDFSKLEESNAKTERKVNRTAAPTMELNKLHNRSETVRKQRLVTCDPSRCRMWSFADRDDSGLNAEECGDLLESMRPPKKQLIPVIARKLNGDPDYDYELIYGKRRRWVCERLDIKLDLTIVNAGDKECLAFMHEENAHRKDITAMERARSFAKQLLAKDEKGAYLFETNGKPSERRLALNLSESRSTVQRSVFAGKLWSLTDACKAIGDVRNLPMSVATKLVEFHIENAEKFDSIVAELLTNKDSGDSSAKKAAFILSRPQQEKGPLSTSFLVEGLGKSVLKEKKDGSYVLTLPKGVFQKGKGVLQKLLLDIEKNIA